MNNKADILALLKKLLGVSEADTSRDSELNALIDGAIGVCEMYLNDVIDRRNVTQGWAYAEFPKILRYRNAGDLVSVELDGADVLSSWSIKKQDSYDTLIKTTGAYAIDGEELVATYPAGFEACPYDLMLVIRDVAAVLESQFGAPSLEKVQRENIVGIGSVDYDRSEVASVGIIPAQCIQILKLYRKHRI
jgi:hypothetical protein